jgi:hypothetical protein
MRVLMMMAAAVLVAGLFGCGSDGGGEEALMESCNTFCVKNAECDPTLPDSYADDCSAACEAGDYNNVEVGLSTNLLACAKYDQGCSEFTQCLSGGGSLTDDEYGQGDLR